MTHLWELLPLLKTVVIVYTLKKGNPLMDHEAIQHRFAFHAATTEEKADAHTSVRQQCQTLAHYINGKCPEGREKSLAITKLEEVMMWANAAIARGV